MGQQDALTTHTHKRTYVDLQREGGSLFYILSQRQMCASVGERLSLAQRLALPFPDFLTRVTVPSQYPNDALPAFVLRTYEAMKGWSE